MQTMEKKEMWHTQTPEAIFKNIKTNAIKNK